MLIAIATTSGDQRPRRAVRAGVGGSSGKRSSFGSACPRADTARSEGLVRPAYYPEAGPPPIRSRRKAPRSAVTAWRAGAPSASTRPLLRGDGLVRLQRRWDRTDRMDGSLAGVHRTRPADIAYASPDAARAQAGRAVRHLHGDEATSESSGALVHRDLLR